MSNTTELTGLTGTNPLGFIAALGVQRVFDGESEAPRLWWSTDVVPHALIDIDIDRIVDQSLRVIEQWSNSYALQPGLFPDGDVKFKPDVLRTYLDTSRSRDVGNSLAWALVAEGSFDGQGVAKPSDLYFTAGQQRILRMALEILRQVTEDDLREALLGPWPYRSRLPSLMWDVVDDRIYALAAYDPAGEQKASNPGVEALALVGLSRIPVFAGKAKTLTQGCFGSWKRGGFSWPIWNLPSGNGAVRSLLAHVPSSGNELSRIPLLRGWGVEIVLEARIRRSAQGGYGTFAPPVIVWQA